MMMIASVLCFQFELVNSALLLTIAEVTGLLFSTFTTAVVTY